MNRFLSGRFYDAMSLQLIAALDDMVVTELIVSRRRNTFLQDGGIKLNGYKLCGLPFGKYD